MLPGPETHPSREDVVLILFLSAVNQFALWQAAHQGRERENLSSHGSGSGF